MCPNVWALPKITILLARVITHIAVSAIEPCASTMLPALYDVTGSCELSLVCPWTEAQAALSLSHMHSASLSAAMLMLCTREMTSSLGLHIVNARQNAFECGFAIRALCTSTELVLLVGLHRARDRRRVSMYQGLSCIPTPCAMHARQVMSHNCTPGGQRT